MELRMWVCRLFVCALCWDLGIAIAPIVSTSSEEDSPALTNTTWHCPHMEQLSGISCTCDLPHTVRCRGQAGDPDALYQLTSALKSYNISLLDLAVHELGTIHADVFQGLDLLGLIITSAGIDDISPEAFSGLQGFITALGMPSNNLSTVPALAIKPLRLLNRLDLSDNLITELVPQVFPTLLGLEQLTLAGNGLRLLPPEAFVRLPNLESLDLARNQIDAAQINDKSLRGLHSLKHLSLKSNLLKGTLTSTFITGAKGLTSLDLSENAITAIPRGALSLCRNLRELDLSHNQIDVIEDHAFINLSDLQTLKLSHNRVVAVSGWSLAHLSSLTHLSMADNALRAVTADLLHQLPQLTTLDLAANDISLLQPHVFNNTPLLQHIALEDNPLHCDCNLAWLGAWLRSHSTLHSEERAGAVCATPIVLENAPCVELKESQLTCSGEGPFHEYYHDYYHEQDYYHDDDASSDDNTPELRHSDAKISLQAAKWIKTTSEDKINDTSLNNVGVNLVWRVDEQAVPYSCDAIYVYEVISTTNDKVHQVLSEKISTNCSSDITQDPYRVAVTIPGSVLIPGSTYRYCLVLLERGTGDQEAFLPGCSEKLQLAAPIGILIGSDNFAPKPEITSFTAGDVNGDLVVHTRVEGSPQPCTYTLAIVSGRSLVATRQLNCTEARHKFPSLLPGKYLACAAPDILNVHHDLDHLEHKLHTAKNITTLLTNTFSACTPLITLEKPREEKHNPGRPWLILLFTLPGLALVVTLYVIARKVHRSGGVPWRWDPRAQKAGKYFLYTGEVTNSSLSLDPQAADPPETTTRV